METVEYKSYTIKIDQDVFADDPTNWGNFTILDFRNRNGNASIRDYLTDDDELVPEMQAKVDAGQAFWFDVYEHSGTVYTLVGQGMNDRWDTSSKCGLIVFSDDYVKGVGKSEREQYAAQDLSLYTQWANGDVYAVEIFDEDGESVDCQGENYGYQEAIDQAKGMIDTYTPPRSSSRDKSAQRLHN
jgi:hypothetical protein